METRTKILKERIEQRKSVRGQFSVTIWTDEKGVEYSSSQPVGVKVGMVNTIEYETREGKSGAYNVVLRATQDAAPTVQAGSDAKVRALQAYTQALAAGCDIALAEAFHTNATDPHERAKNTLEAIASWLKS